MPRADFLLRVRGLSMIEAGIFDNDTVLIKRQDSAETGEIVVALIDDEATCVTAPAACSVSVLVTEKLSSESALVSRSDAVPAETIVTDP